MPVDNRGFNRRQIVSKYPDRSLVHDLIFNFYHGPLGYSLRRYTPSLEFLAIVVGLFYISGDELSSRKRMFLFLALPFARNKLQEQRLNRPYTLEVFLEGCWQTSKPNVIYFIT
jgi:hypothetical protein